MKSLLLNSFLLFVLSACHFGYYKRLKPISESQAIVLPLTPIFQDSFNSFLFKTNMSLYGKTMSGLLLAKQVKKNFFRVVFTTEIGMKLFDFEFRDSSFVLHYCVEQFNKPLVIQTIRKDIETVLMSNLGTLIDGPLNNRNKTHVIYKYKLGKGYNYCFLNNASKHLEKIENAGKRRIKAVYFFENYQTDFPADIRILHRDIKLKIDLHLLKQQSAT